MIICRSPLRISLGGGGTDLPSFYNKHSGFVISAAINKYVYVIINKPFRPGIYLKYSKIEKKEKVEKINHPIIREVLKEEKLFNYPIEITTLADIPAGTGLGSSGSFTVALIKALYFQQKKIINTNSLAKKACDIEILRLKEPSGKQDQYISAHGGLKCFYFKKNNQVEIKELSVLKKNLNVLQNNLLLFYTGYTRRSKKILSVQKKLSDNNNKIMINNLKEVKRMGLRSKFLLETGDFESFADLLNEHWKKKMERSKNMSNEKINMLYDGALKNGALGGKLIGAGGGGFLLLYSKHSNELRNYFVKQNIQEVQYKFDFEGAKIILP